MRSPGRLFFPLAAILVLTDCTTKRAIEDSVPYVGASRPVIDDYLRFTLVYNQGAAFSMDLGPYQRWVLIGLALVVLGVLARSYGEFARVGRAAITGLALVTGGAIGNLLDRITSDRGVVDFIDIGIGTSRFYVFNVADVGVSIGAALLVYALWRSDVDRGRSRESAPT